MQKIVVALDAQQAELDRLLADLAGLAGLAGLAARRLDAADARVRAEGADVSAVLALVRTYA